MQNENTGLKEICTSLLNENKKAKHTTSARYAQTQSYTNVIKDALIVRSSDNGNMSDKRVKIAKALAGVPIDRTKETAGGALVMNFKSKEIMEKEN